MKIFVLLLFISGTVLGQDYTKLKKLVQYEVNLLEKSKIEGDEVHYRLFELYSERLKLTFYEENQKFLKIEDISKHNNKTSYFPETQKLFKDVQSYGGLVLKKFPSTKRKSDILYTLALNARDFNGGAGSEKLLKESLKLATKKGQAFHARTSLAETLYNDKKYPEAIKHYEEVVKNLDDPWLPKHWLNLGWCYLKTDRMDQAISALQTSYGLAGTKKYIDIKAQVAQNMVPFWVQAARVDQGIAYFKKNVPDPYENLLSLAKKASDKGFINEVETIFVEIKKTPNFNKNFERQEETLLFKLNFYRAIKSWVHHYTTSVYVLRLYKSAKAVEPPVELKSYDEMLDNVKAIAGFHQMSLTKNINKNGGKDFDKAEADLVLKYFSLLQFLNPDEKPLYLYYMAESLYGIHDYNGALKYYKGSLAFFDAKAQMNQKQRKNATPVSKEKPDLDKKILTSLLSLAGEDVFSKEENHKVLIFTYSSYIAHLPTDSVAKDIYPKLFRLYLEEKKDVEATALLRQYESNFKSDLKSQQDLLKEMINHYIKVKNDTLLSSWIIELKKGFLAFPPADIEKTEVVLADILFFNAFELNKKGDHEEAIEQFEVVYKKTSYPNKLRSKAAFHAGEVALEADESSSAINWFENSIQVNDVPDLQLEVDHWVKVLDKMVFLYEMRGSVRLFDQILDKTCKYKSPQQDILFQRIVNFHLILADDYLSKSFLNKEKACLHKAETFNNVIDLMMAFYTEHNEFSNLVKVYGISSYKPAKTYAHQLIELFWENPMLEEEILKELSKLKDVSDAAKFVALQKTKVRFMSAQTPLLEKKFAHLIPFDGEKFSTDLDNYLKQVQSFISANKDISKDGDEFFQSSIIKSWANFYSTIEEKITTLRIKDEPEMMTSFENEMKNVAKPFSLEAQKLWKLTADHPNGDRKSIPLDPMVLSSSFNLDEIKSNQYLSYCFEDKMKKFMEMSHAHFKRDARDWKYWSQLGHCLLWKGELREALFYLKSAHGLAKANDEKGEVFLLMAVAYLKLGRIQKGFNYLEEARKLIPSVKMIAFNLSLIYLHYDQPVKALEYLGSQDESKDEITYLKGLGFLQKKEVREAKRYLSRLPSSYIERDDSSLSFAQLSLLEGEWMEAEKILNRRTSSKYPLIEARQKELRKKIDEFKSMRFNK